MKVNKIGFIFFVASLLYLIIFFSAVPIALKMESWALVFIVLYSPLLIFGLALIIFGIYYSIRDYREIKMEKLFTLLKILGYISLLIGFLYMLGWSYYGWLLFIPGIFIIYFGFKEEDYVNSLNFTLDLVIFFGVFFLGFIVWGFIIAIHN